MSNSPEHVHLHVFATEGLTLENAWSVIANRFADESVLALCYGPAEVTLACRFEGESKFVVCRAVGEEVVTKSFECPCPKSYYEVRVFASTGELRWLNDPRGEGGTASWVTDTPNDERCNVPGDGWRRVDTHGDDAVERLSTEYLLWGASWRDGPVPDDRWSCLAEGRIGRWYVPLGGVEDRVVLESHEYVGTESGVAGDHGNVTVMAERLYGIGTPTAVASDSNSGDDQ